MKVDLIKHVDKFGFGSPFDDMAPNFLIQYWPGIGEGGFAYGENYAILSSFSLGKLPLAFIISSKLMSQKKKAARSPNLLGC